MVQDWYLQLAPIRNRLIRKSSWFFSQICVMITVDMPLAGKTGIWEDNPNTQTIRFAGRWLNLSAVARAQGFHPSYLSYIFSGKRQPAFNTLKKLTAALGMTLDDFTQALHERIKEVEENRRKTVEIYQRRVAREDTKDLAIIQDGRIPIPRLPALRSA